MNTYEINEDTLALVPTISDNVRVYEKESSFDLNSSCSEIIDNSCMYYGSTYEGRRIGSMHMLGASYKLPIIVDPSHASGQSYMVEDMSKAALAAGADGLIIETHINPRLSLCDSKQTIDIKTLDKIIKFRKEIEKYED